LCLAGILRDLLLDLRLLLLDELLSDELLKLQLESFAALLPVNFFASRLKKRFRFVKLSEKKQYAI